MKPLRNVRAALFAAGALLSLAGTVPAHAALGDEIACAGQLTSWTRDAFNGWVGNGSATCVVVDNDAPAGTTVSTVGIYASGGACVGGSYGFLFTARGHQYFLSYYAPVTAAGLVQPGVLTGAQKDSALYTLLGLDPIAGTAVLTDARVMTGVCTGWVEPKRTIAFTFDAVLPQA